MFMGIYQGIKKVLIIGGGYGALRYVESLIWDSSFEITMCGIQIYGKSELLAKQYGLDFIPFDCLTQNKVKQYECIIVALPVNVKYKYVRELVETLGYCNTIILEKPLTIHAEELELYKKNETNLQRVCVVCQRDFFRDKYCIRYNDKHNTIIFPSYVKDEKFNVVNMLPHILSWLITEDDSIEYLKRQEENIYEGIWRNAPLRITFIERKNNYVTINGVKYPDVEYRKINKDIVKTVIKYNAEEVKSNIKKAMQVSNIIVNILEENFYESE